MHAEYLNLDIWKKEALRYRTILVVHINIYIYIHIIIIIYIYISHKIYIYLCRRYNINIYCKTITHDYSQQTSNIKHAEGRLKGEDTVLEAE